MNSLVAKSIVIAVLSAAPLVSAADRAGAAVFPAPVHLMNLAPSFARHPSDLVLLAPAARETRPSKIGTLTLSPSSRPDSSRPTLVKREDAANFHFDARLPASSLEIRPPQNGTLYFTSVSAGSSEKKN